MYFSQVAPPLLCLIANLIDRFLTNREDSHAQFNRENRFMDTAKNQVG